jgi:steroid delta-isomerase-like uncharacterized protein
MTSTEQNLALVRRAVDEVWNRADYSRLDEILVDDFIVHATGTMEDLHGPAGVKAFYTTLHEAFPDLAFTIEDQVASGDRVVTRWSARGTHRGAFEGIAPTGKQVELTGIDIDRIVDGRVVECWPQVDQLGLLVQLGALSIPT